MASDDFNRPDETPLNSNWATPTGLGSLKLVGNAVEVGTLNVDSAAMSTVSTAAASYVEVTDVTGRNGGPAVHLDNSGGGYVLLNHDVTNFYIYRLPFFDTIAFTSGLTYQLADIIGLRRVGNTLVASQEGSDVLTSDVDNTHTGGRPGIFIYNEARFDNWNDGVTGGPFSVDPTAAVALSGAHTVTGAVVSARNVVPTTSAALSGTISVAGTLAIGVNFEVDAPLLVSAAGSIAAAGTLALGLTLSGSVAVGGSVGVTGTLQLINGAFALTPSSALAMAGAVGTSSGAVALGLTPTGSVAASGTVGVSGVLQVVDGALLLAPTVALALTGGVAPAGSIALGVNLSGGVALSGAPSVGGAVLYGIPVLVGPAAAVNANGQLSVAGSIVVTLDTDHVVALTRSLALSGTAGAAGAFAYAMAATLSALAGVAGGLAVSGVIHIGTGLALPITTVRFGALRARSIRFSQLSRSKMQVVNEGTSASRVVQFSDKDGEEATPSSVSYRIDCVTSGQAVRALTTLAPAASIEITLTPADNGIKEPRNSQETKRVTVVAQYGGAGDQVTGQFDYVVQRLPYLVP